MEEAKRVKQIRKKQNAESGKDVDIDFELMIQENKFREKLLSPHTPSDQLKVNISFMAVGCLREEASYIQKGVAEWVDRFDIMREPSDKNS